MIFKKGLAPMTIEKIKILGATLKLPAKQHCKSSPYNVLFTLIRTKHSSETLLHLVPINVNKTLHT